MLLYHVAHPLFDLENRYLPEGSEFVETEYMWGQLYVYVHKGTRVEIQVTKTLKPIGRSMTVPPPVSSLNSIPPPLSSHCAFITSRKKFVALLKCVVRLFTLLKLRVRSCVNYMFDSSCRSKLLTFYRSILHTWSRRRAPLTKSRFINAIQDIYDTFHARNVLQFVSVNLCHAIKSTVWSNRHVNSWQILVRT
jgi:hypothetical protein